MQKFLFIALSIFVLTVSSFAQVPSEKMILQMLYNDKFTQGNFLMLPPEENYPQALKMFLEAYQIDSMNSNINYKIGLCYLKMESSKQLSLRYLAKGVKNTTKNYKVSGLFYVL